MVMVFRVRVLGVRVRVLRIRVWLTRLAMLTRPPRPPIHAAMPNPFKNFLKHYGFAWSRKPLRHQAKQFENIFKTF